MGLRLNNLRGILWITQLRGFRPWVGGCFTPPGPGPEEMVFDIWNGCRKLSTAIIKRKPAGMIKFNTTIQRFGSMGEKTGWTYILVPAKLAAELLPGNKKSFRVKGKLDQYPISKAALIPMGGGDFILPLKADLRKKIGKSKGASLQVQITVDKEPPALNHEFMECLADEPAAREFFLAFPRSHQLYFSRWIESAKTEQTKAKRIAQAVNALSRKMNYAEMLRSLKKDREQLGGIP
jgi:hypothetical protein